MGNVCRSPTAEAVMRKLVAEKGLSDTIMVDSAGTGSWHEGQRADERARATASARGVELTGRARSIRPSDYLRNELILAVDRQVLATVKYAAPASCTAEMRMFSNVDVPDPYYGGPDGFEDVFDQIEHGCRELLSQLQHELPA
jgi:protein-tyrosine phosphatase